MSGGLYCSNDVVLLHRLAMSRVRSLLGVCNLLRGMHTKDEAYEDVRAAIALVEQARLLLQEACPYDTPYTASGLY